MKVIDIYALIHKILTIYVPPPYKLHWILSSRRSPRLVRYSFCEKGVNIGHWVDVLAISVVVPIFWRIILKLLYNSCIKSYKICGLLF
jgi:hypothetical protein